MPAMRGKAGQCGEDWADGEPCGAGWGARRQGEQKAYIREAAVE
jgi:hypothetical protein